MNQHKDIPNWAVNLVCIVMILLVFFAIYSKIATQVFQYRHPKANSMIFWHEPKAVLTFGTVESYK